ncbi:MAG: hypothetical protein ACXWL5_05160, partial [Candidatus Chromulinivorax sp.]
QEPKKAGQYKHHTPAKVAKQEEGKKKGPTMLETKKSVAQKDAAKKAAPAKIAPAKKDAAKKPDEKKPADKKSVQNQKKQM